MNLDVEPPLCGAGYGIKSNERSNSRNGYRDHLWQAHAGDVELRIPKPRQGSYFPPFLETPAHGRESVGSSDPGDLRARYLHPLGR